MSGASKPHRDRTNRLSAGGLVLNAIGLAVSVSCLLPLLWMLYSSVKSESEFAMSIVALPRSIQLSNYARAIQLGKFGRYFANSVAITVAVVAIVLACTFVVGYFVARYRFPGRKAVYVLFLSGLLIPIHALMVPIFLQFRDLGLLNTRVGLILAVAATNMPVSVFLFESYVHQIPRSLDEAAYIDGASTRWVLTRVAFPLCRPVAFTSALLCFISAWNEFPLVLVLIRSESKGTLPIGLTNFVGQYRTDFTSLLAALVLVTIPLLVLYVLFNNQIARGMTAGAVKG